MKNLLTFVVAVTISVSTFAEKIKIRESKEDIGGGQNNAFVVTLYGVNPSDAEDSFRSFMKQYNGNRSSKDGGIFVDNAEMKEISNGGTVDVYGKALGKKDAPEITFIVAFDIGLAFLNSSDYKDQAKAAEKIIREFAVKTTKEAIEAQLKSEQKAQKRLEGAQEDLVKENKDLHDDIEKYKGKIKKAEDDIVKNNSDQEKKKTEIAAQKKVVESVEAKLKAVE